jgi:hypothetical protein
MKNISFLFAGILTTALTVGTTGCSDNNADRAQSSTSTPTQNGTMYSSTAHSISSESGTGISTGSTSSDESNEHIVDPAGSGTGGQLN